jgi:hypothetical protein
MNELSLTVSKSPREVAAIFDRLRNAPLAEVFAAVGLPALEIQHTTGRAHAYSGDAPDSLSITYSRAPMLTPYDTSRTIVEISAAYPEGRALASLITAALSA